MSNPYGISITGDYGQFSNDERLNYALKIALQRVQTDLKIDWFREPNDYIPKQPNEIYKNVIPSYSDILNYVLIDDNIDGNGTRMATNITVNQILQAETHSKYTLSQILNTNLVRDITQYNNLTDSNFIVQDNKRVQIKLLSRNMYTRYNYWINGLTGRASLTQGGLNTTLSESIRSTSGTTPSQSEPLNAFITNGSNGDANSINDERVWDTINSQKNDQTAATTIFYNKLIQYSAPISIINRNDIDPDNPHNLEKQHPFLKVYVQVPLYSTKNSFLDNFNEFTVAGDNTTDNIGFTNPVLEKSLGDINGIPYKMFGYKGTAWENINTSTGGDIFYFLNNPGFILGYGIKNPRFGQPFSQLYPPMISYVRYVGETLTDGVISQLQGLPNPSIYNEKELRIDTSTNTIYRLGRDETNQKAWISIGGGGGGGGKWSDVEEEEGSIYYKDGNVYIGKDNGTYTLDLSGSFNLNDKLKSTTTGIDISTSVIIKGNLTVDGNYTIRGDSYIIHTDEVEISNNTIILNSNIEDKSYGGLPDIELESGIIIKRAKIDDEKNAEPFKIVYKDERSDDDEYLSIGISGDLHRVATIKNAKLNTNHSQFIKWNGESGQLIPDVDISSSDTHLYVNKKLQTNNDIYTPSFEEPFSSVFPHQDENKDIGLWGILNKMFDQPPKFKENGVIPTTTEFTINWSKSYNTLKFAPTGSELPFIKNIWIDIWNGSTWLNVKNNLSSTDSSFNFEVGTTYGGIIITTKETYKVRVYGVNDSGSTTYNFLEFDNLGVKQAGKPTAPRSVLFPSSTYNKLTFKYTAPESFDENIPNSTQPLLQNYEIKYKPIRGGTNYNSIRHRGVTDLNINEISVLVDNKLTQTSNINSTISHNPSSTRIYPDMSYEFVSITAKNTLNDDRSENGVSDTLTIITPTVPIDYGGTNPIFPNLVGKLENESARRTIITDAKRPLRLVNGTSSTTVNYFNVPNTSTRFGIEANVSEIYVNRKEDKLGRQIAGVSNVATVKIEYSTDGTFVEDKTLNFNGFEANTYNGTTTIENGRGSRVLNFENDSNINSYTGTDPAYNGYGLKGIFRLSAISDVIGSSGIFQPKTTKQSVRYIVNSPSLNNVIYTYDFYVDDLNGNPTVVINDVSLSNINTKWCYGIPSVNTFTLNVNYTIENYASKFLPSDGIYARIESSGILPVVIDTGTTTTITPLITKTRSYTDKTLNNSINDNTISNIVKVIGYSLNSTSGISRQSNLIHGSKLFLDTPSFSGANLVSLATDNIFVYNNSDPYNLSPISNANASNFSLADNQLMFYNGAFYSGGNAIPNAIAFGNYSTEYFDTNGKDHSGKKNLGDTVGTTTYKWVTKKVATNIFTNDGTTRRKTINIELNGSSITISDNANLIVYVLQSFIGGVSQVHNNPTTIWFNASKEFNTEAFSTNTYNNYNANNDNIGINQGGNSVDLDVNATSRCDIYVRVGLSISSKSKITSISMS